MSADFLRLSTVVVPNPEWTSRDEIDRLERVNRNISYYSEIFEQQTLSTNNAVAGATITGLLYVPEPEESNERCRDLGDDYIPPNATRLANLPSGNDYDLVAAAPWLSDAECVLSYLSAARRDPSVRAFVTWLPDDNAEGPPLPSSPQWGLSNGGRWKGSNPFPVYAISGMEGQDLMDQIGLYSGNMTAVPSGSNLTEMYESKDYARLRMEIRTNTGGNDLPSLWIFLLIVLAVLLGVICAISLSMHWLQRRRRRALRRRVMTGQVDLEALGIKRLTVPQNLLDRMPLYSFGSTRPNTRDSTSYRKTATSDDSSRPGSPSSDAQPVPATRAGTRHSPMNQPTCPICLDDFVATSPTEAGTIVRELPCRHIFHPDCVDTFLKDNSSLCPMCKTTALPQGYCPKVVTNAMVRRERMLRRNRPHTLDPESASTHRDEAADDLGSLSFQDRVRARAVSGFSTLRSGRRISSVPTPASHGPVQMTQPPPAALARSNTGASRRPATDCPNETQQSRRELARQRAVVMLGNRAPDDPDAEEAQRMPRWRKVLRGVFPGLGR